MPAPASSMPQQMVYVPMPAAPNQQQPAQTSALHVPLPQFDHNMLNTLQDATSRRQVIGNAVYPAINSVLGESYASKITGMVIDENAVDLVRLMQDQAYFNKNVSDAYTLLGG